MARLTISFNPATKSPFPVKMILKNSIPVPKPVTPSIFQAAARTDEFAAAQPAVAIPLNQKMPFTDLMLHPEKVEAVLRLMEQASPANGKKSARSKATAERGFKRNA
jgi:hypothetical protein